MSISGDQERNREMVRRYKAGDPAQTIARDNGVSYARAMQIIARTIMRGGGAWYDDKLPTMTRNAISNAYYFQHKDQPTSAYDLWTRPEREVAEMVAGIGLNNLRCTPNLGMVGLCHIKRWLGEHGLELK